MEGQNLFLICAVHRSGSREFTPEQANKPQQWCFKSVKMLCWEFCVSPHSSTFVHAWQIVHCFSLISLAFHQQIALLTVVDQRGS